MKQCKTCLMIKSTEIFSSGKRNCKPCVAERMKIKRSTEKNTTKLEYDANLSEDEIPCAQIITPLETSLIFFKQKEKILYELLQNIEPSREYVNMLHHRMVDLIRIFDSIKQEQYSLYFPIQIDPKTNTYITKMIDDGSKYNRIRAGTFIGDKNNHDFIKQKFNYCDDDIQNIIKDMIDINNFVDAIGNGYAAIYNRYRDASGDWISNALDQFTVLPVYDEKTSTIVIENPLKFSVVEYLNEIKIKDHNYHGLVLPNENNFERLEKKLIKQ